MTWTTTQLTTLEESIALGATTVQYSDRTVTYRSLTDMMRLRDMIRKDLGLTGTTDGSIGNGKRKYYEFDKGL
jgi:hypothetical protein